MPIPTPKTSEKQSEFMQRCMGDEKMVNEYPTEQRAAVCRTAFEEKLATEKVSFDYDGTLTTAKAMNLALKYIEQGVDVYIISARSEKDGMINKANRIGIPESRIYATGSNKAKVEKIKELGITIHYDNNKDVINELGEIGRLI